MGVSVGKWEKGGLERFIGRLLLFVVEVVGLVSEVSKIRTLYLLQTTLCLLLSVVENVETLETFPVVRHETLTSHVDGEVDPGDGASDVGLHPDPLNLKKD